MNARYFIIGMAVLKLCFYSFETIVMEKQKKKPLPLEVSDIYEKKRYETFLLYDQDYRKLSIVSKMLSLLVLGILTFSNMYTGIETIAKGNVYGICMLTYIIYFVVEAIESYLLEYYVTFKIEEKYGLNKKTKKEFHREYILTLSGELLMMPLLLLLIIFIGEHLPIWTKGFTLSFTQSLFICGMIFALFTLFMVFASFFSIYMMKKQYTFTPLEENALKQKIEYLQKDAKRKVKKIYVYDESKKSTSKNAFLLRFLWIREFGIADNFILENKEEELLAVLSHEIGHLKHKKNILDYIGYIFLVVFFFFSVYLLSHSIYIDMLLDWICTSFAITSNNYYMNINIVLLMFSPFLFLYSLYRNYTIRMQEYEADKEAVKNGYGDALIQTFKKMSKDELVNVNPSYIIEVLEYNHPGMYRRIKAIMEEIKNQGS